MNTLAVDIGGTKFAVALFEDDKMIRRESRPTDREGARDLRDLRPNFRTLLHEECK